MTLSLLLPRLIRPLILFVFASLFCTPSLAQPAGAQGDNFIYRVISGDTLIAVSERFTDRADHWRTLQTLNAVQEPTALPIGLELKIPFSLIPELPAHAQVTHVAGQARTSQGPLAAGNLVAEGDVVHTEANGFVTLTLEDGSALTIPAQSALRLERLRVFKGTALTDTIFTLEDGSLESQVAPQGTGVGRFEIRTPVSITGVRGTHLRVHANAQGAQSEVLAGAAGLSAGDAESARLRPGQGAAVNPDGKLLGVKTLLPAPVLAAPVRDGGGWTTTFPPVAGASAYLLRVAGDPQGTQLYSSQRINSTEASFRAPGAGTYYVMVRGIDADGLNGADAVQPFLGQSTLQSSDGAPISTQFGQFVVLTDY